MAKKKIAIFTASEGHESITEAIREILQDEYEVKIFKYTDPVLFRIYLVVYQLFPGIYKIPFDLAKRGNNVELVRKFFLRKYFKRVSAFYTAFKPDLVISCYLFYNPSIEKLVEKDHTPFINILTDPISVHPLLLSPHATVNIAYNDESIKRVRELAPDLTKKCRIEPMGWFVRQRFQPVADIQALRRELHLEPTLPTFLISSGSEGTSHILKILSAILRSPQPLQIIVACGSNATLQRSVQNVYALAKRFNPQHTLLALKFTPDINRYMQAADLIIGKAGPNSLFESIACHKPFFAITHISGQEDGNLELIKENQVGFVEERISAAQQLLVRLLAQPSLYTSLLPHVRKVAKYNTDAGLKLATLVKHLLTTPV